VITPPSVLILGGVPRAGKTALARRIWQARSIPALSIDAVIETFLDLAPQAGLNWQPSGERDDKVLKAARRIIGKGLLVHKQVLVEGEAMTPAVTSRLGDEWGLRSCFLGLVEPSRETILRHEGDNPWVGTLSTHEQNAVVDSIARRSSQLQQECERRKLPFIDMSRGNYRDRADHAIEMLAGLSQERLI